MEKRIIILSLMLLALTEMSMAEIVEKQSEEGLFVIKTQIEPSRPIVGNNIITLTIYDRRSNTPLEGARIEVVPWMTIHGHGSSKKTRIEEKGNGVYKVEDVYFTMEGDWDLLVNIQRNKTEDKVIITFKKVKK